MDTRVIPAVSVLVPTWRRAESLARCLRALAAQSVAPLEVVVAMRAGDEATVRCVDALSLTLPFPILLSLVDGPGVIAAMNAGLAMCRGEIVALTDDDAEPSSDWIARIVACFADPAVGGAGGRDWQPFERGTRDVVGRVQWFGRVIGNHHLGAGEPRCVDVLKGVNCAFRAHLLRSVGFDTRLAGSGAQMFWELVLCLALRRAGWKLLYDPAIAVDHHIEPRHDADQRHRGLFDATSQADAVHNETLALLEHLQGARRLAFIAWALAVGTRGEPGVLQVARLGLRGDRHAFSRWWSTLEGRARGWQRWRAEAADHAARLPRPGDPVAGR